MNIVKLKLGNGTVLVESAETDGVRRVGIADTLEVLDKSLDRMLKHEVLENCKILASAFQDLQSTPLPPKKAQAEFGLSFTAEGSIYVVKSSAAANFKVTFAWDLTGEPQQKP